MDPRKKKVLSILGVASVILIWRGYAIVTQGLPGQTQAETVVLPEPNSEPRIVQPFQDQEDMKALWILQAKLTARQWTDHDPFEGLEITIPKGSFARPEHAEPEEYPDPPKLVFQGVSEVKGNQRALVDGRIVKVGDTFESGVVVSEITRNTITLTNDPWRYKYMLGIEGVTVYEGSEEP
ncbi:MAG: hypothetical protein O7F76_12475 [Planctomycetota bacterium]|nr:hypothetical protein [Planctomycetota bacterium]